MTVRVAVIYYSATGNVYRLAEAVAEGATTAGADVRLRRAAELAPPAAIDANPAWRQHVDAIAEHPTRFGNVAAQLKQFLDQAGPLWMRGALADKAATSFASAINRHGGHESTLLALNNTLYHWGAIIVPVGYTNPLLYAAGGNPYGTSFVSGMHGDRPDIAILDAAR